MKVGIDLGTTFCAVARLDEAAGKPVIIPNPDGEAITPSVIQFLEDGQIVVGTEAKEAFEAGEDGCVSTFKRSMGTGEVYCRFGGKSYTAVDLSAILLRYLKEEAEAAAGEPIEEAVVTVPAYFYHRERKATMEAAKRAGLKVRQIINEPTAAALCYGAGHWRENACILVYDLGGGTFDVTLVRMGKGGQMETLGTQGDHLLGGRDWDGRICRVVSDKILAETGIEITEYPEAKRELDQAAEAIKKQLSARSAVPVRLQIPGYGRYETRITREEFEAASVDLLEKTGFLCDRLLQDLGLRWADITDVLLVGGSTRMKQVGAFLERRSGRVPLAGVHPDEAVALGAAIQVHLPMPDYAVMQMAPPAEEPREEGGFRFLRRKKTSPAAAGKPAGKAGAAGPGYFAPGPVGEEKALESALMMSNAEVQAHAMGVIAVSADGTRYINKTIIPPNAKIPVKCAQAFQYRTSARGENEVEIYVLQGTAEPLACEIIGKYVVSGITHDRADNPTRIRIQYSYDVNGLIHVQARQGESCTDLPIREEPVPEDMSRFGMPIEPEERTTVVAEDISVVMAVDVSGSMAGGPLADALKAMCGFVDQFSDYPGECRIGVVAVSDRSQEVQRLTTNFAKCKASIRSITCGMTGACNDAHPFDTIRDMLSGGSGRKIAIVLADAQGDGGEGGAGPAPEGDQRDRHRLRLRGQKVPAGHQLRRHRLHVCGAERAGLELRQDRPGDRPGRGRRCFRTDGRRDGGRDLGSAG